MSRKMIVKNVLLGLFVLCYGFLIVGGFLAGFYFPSSYSSDVWGKLLTPNGGEGWLVIGIALGYTIAYFVLERLTRLETSRLNEILHIVLCSEMFAFGMIALIQGGDWWVWIFIITGALGLFSGFHLLSKLGKGK